MLAGKRDMGCGASSRPSKIEGDEEEPSSSDQVQVLQPSISAAPPSTKGEVQNFDSAPESDSSSVVAQSTLPYGDGESDEHAQQECRRTSGRIVNVTGSGLTHIGFGDPPLKKENQDTFRLHLHCFAGIDGCAYLAVFDGHGNHGELVAQFAASQMEEIVRTRLETLDCWSPSSVRELLKASFLECEREIEQAPSIGFRGKMSGTTATVAIVLDGILYVASVGDSRLVLLDLYGNPERLSADHRPENETERERIIQAGGCVRSSARFQGENETEQVVEDGTKVRNYDRSAIKDSELSVDVCGQRVPLRVWLRKDQQKPNGLLQPGPGLMLTR